jgi:hypothetical protein
MIVVLMIGIPTACSQPPGRNDHVSICLILLPCVLGGHAQSKYPAFLPRSAEEQTAAKEAWSLVVSLESATLIPQAHPASTEIEPQIRY